MFARMVSAKGRGPFLEGDLRDITLGFDHRDPVLRISTDQVQMSPFEAFRDAAALNFMYSN